MYLKCIFNVQTQLPLHAHPSAAICLRCDQPEQYITCSIISAIPVGSIKDQQLARTLSGHLSMVLFHDGCLAYHYTL